MAVSAASTFFAVATEAKVVANRSVWCCCRMRVWTVKFYTVTLGEVDTVGHTLWAKIVR